MQSIASYEAVPYLSKFFIRTHPDHLAVLGTLFGMEPPNIEKSRVLELGCGNGSNLIAHAFSLPGSDFVGVDLAERHIEEGNQFIADLGLTNIKLHQLDVMKMSAEEFGKFDYIIAHGLFSWVPEFVREKLLQVYKELLTENGIGYISYNVYPGSHVREIAQKPMRFWAAKYSDHAEKVNNGVSFLKFIADETNETEILQPILRDGLKAVLEKQMPDILHDDLSDIVQPFYFHEFAERLETNNLQFLSETDLPKMSTQGFSAKAKSFIDSIDDLVEREQYKDFFDNRFFRKTLVCHRDITLDHQPAPGILDKFLVLSSIRPANKKPDLITWSSEKFVGFEDYGFEIDHPLTKMSLFLLGQKWAKATPLLELLEEAKQILEKRGFATDDWENEFQITRQVLLQISMNTDFISLHLYQPTAVNKVGLKPEINKLARWQLGLGENVYTVLNQNFNASDPVLRHLLELMDGTRNKSDLLKSLKDFLKTKGESVVHKDISEKLETYLALLARMGMFV